MDEFEVWEEQIGPDLIEKTDARLGYTVYKLGDIASDWGELTEDATGMPHQYYPRKFFNPAAELAPFGDPNPNGGSNDRIIRLADVLLMHAEACQQLGDESTAVASLNMVRSRASVPLIEEGSVSGQALLDAIWHERRVELGLEGHRFFDLVRQGRAADVLEGFVPGKSELFPIPTAEITLSNGQLTQNPGYE